MTDYISREAALEAIKTAELGQEYEAVEAIPAADVVEVVRCRDCKWFELMPNRPDRKGFCHIWGALDEPRYCTNGDYCSNGTRKGR